MVSLFALSYVSSILYVRMCLDEVQPVLLSLELSLVQCF